jgi:hypothetical protein
MGIGIFLHPLPHNDRYTIMSDFAAILTSLTGATGALAGGSTSTSQSLSEFERVLATVMQEMISTSTSSAATAEQSQQRSQELADMLQNVVQNIQTTTTNWDTQDLESIRGILTQFETQFNDLATKQANAIETGTALATGARDSAIAEVLRQGIGDIAMAGTNVGAYDSTVQSNMANELGARAADVGAQTELNTIMQQQQIAGANASSAQNALAGIMQLLQGAVSQTSQTGTTDTSQQSSATVDTEGTSTSQTDQTTSTQESATSTTQTESEREAETKAKEKQAGLLKTIFG